MFPRYVSSYVQEILSSLFFVISMANVSAPTAGTRNICNSLLYPPRRRSARTLPKTSTRGSFVIQESSKPLRRLLSKKYQSCTCLHFAGGKLRHLRLSSTTIIWRPLDSRFAQLEQRLWRHKKWFESETASQNHDHDQVSQNRREYVGFLAAQAEKIELGEGEEHRMARRCLFGLSSEPPSY